MQIGRNEYVFGVRIKCVFSKTSVYLLFTIKKEKILNDIFLLMHIPRKIAVRVLQEIQVRFFCLTYLHQKVLSEAERPKIRK